jgi:hypothetical protein
VRRRPPLCQRSRNLYEFRLKEPDMPGPAPKVNPVRRNARIGPVRLPAEGRKGVPPSWPLPGRCSRAGADAWAELWATPQAVVWERLGAGCVREVARYCRLRTEAEKPGAAVAQQAQVTALSDRLGLTPKAMRMLRWEIVVDEVGEHRGSSGARGRVKAV